VCLRHRPCIAEQKAMLESDELFHEAATGAFYRSTAVGASRRCGPLTIDAMVRSAGRVRKVQHGGASTSSSRRTSQRPAK